MSTKKYTYILRTNEANNTSHEGFRWPKKGLVEAPDFKPTKMCGNGLHGLNMGMGDPGLLNWANDAKWLVVKVFNKDIIDLGDKVKFSKGVVVYNGDRKGATDYLISKGANPSLIPGAYVQVGNDEIASAGYKGTASAGYYGTANAGDYGTASAGDYGTASVGYKGTANTGYMGTASAGIKGKISIDYYDKVSDRMRTKIGYIGEDGLEPNTKYKLNDKFEFVKA